jgi:quinol monooxygenase YgiN
MQITAAAALAAAQERASTMYGLIGKIKAHPGRREDLVKILLEGSGEMPGCLSYIVAKDSKDADGIWVTEVWESEADHKASLGLASVKAAIAKGRPLISAFESFQSTEPVGGTGLTRRG